MKFKIHFAYASGEKDYGVVEGETIEECKEEAAKFMEGKPQNNVWSEEIKE